MSRPRLFDPACALDAARAVFETRGFDGTSVQDLVDATGLSRSSLYGAFGDKQGLYLAALDRHAAASRAGLAQACAGAASPLGAVRAILDDAAGDGMCFSDAADRAATCPHAAARASGAWAALCRTFADALGEAQATGAFSADRDADAVAQTLAATVHGLRAMRAVGAPAEARQAVARTAFEALVGGA